MDAVNPLRTIAPTREQQPLISGLREDGRVLVGPPMRDLLTTGAPA